MGSSRRFVLVWLLATLLAACGGSGEDPPPATGTTGGSGSTAPSPTGATAGSTGVSASDACALVTEADASAVLEGPVEIVEDPAGEGLINDPAVGAIEDVCYYRPVPDDGDRVAVVVTFVPGSITEQDLQEIAASGSDRAGGMNFRVWSVDQTILVSKEDRVLVVGATTEPGRAPDESAEYALATLAAGRLPGEPAGPENTACQLFTSELASSTLGGAEVIASGGVVIDDQTSGCGFAGMTEPSVMVVYLTTGPLAAERFATFEEGDADSEDYAEVTDLGDDAFQSYPGISVLVGDTFVDVNVTTGPGVADYEAARTIAEALIPQV